MQSSRKVFGLVEGQKVALLVDSSNSNMSFGRAIELQDALLVIKKILKISFSNFNHLVKILLFYRH